MRDIKNKMAQDRNEESVFAPVDNHRMHVFMTGVRGGRKLVFLSGSGTVSPVHDFKVLYEKLCGTCRTIVVEKFGYGESDRYEGSYDIDSLVSYLRQALKEAGEEGPYVLVPHSMAGLEALRWKQTYPEEVLAIIGLDMATPLTYREWTPRQVERRVRFMKRMRRWLDRGLLFWFPLNTRSLTKEEVRRQRELWRRNAFNRCYIGEAEAVIANAETVETAGEIDCPMLMFVSNGKEVSSNWIRNVQKFASGVQAETVFLDCGHYVHHYESESISRKILEFISTRI